MIPRKEWTCSQCASSEGTYVVMKLGKDNKVRFSMECMDCGSFSHFLVRSDINHAVETWLEENLSSRIRERN